jgi:hypothetical protein
MTDETFSLEDDAPADDEPGDESGLSQHPETVARRKRRKRKTTGAKRGAYKPRVPTSSEVTQRLHESLAALADALTERDPELSRVLKRDGPKMADLLGKWGDHPKTPPPVKVAVVVIAEVLEPLRAFGATVRILLRRLRERRLREPEPELDDNGQPLAWSLPEQPTLDDEPVLPSHTPPDRFRADAEPPEVN